MEIEQVLNATERAIGLAQLVGVELEVVKLPTDIKDPDELIQKHGVESWRVAIATAIPAVQWVIEQYSTRENLSTAEGKRRFSTAALTLIRQLHDPVEQEHYLNEISQATGASMTALKVKLTGKSSEKSSNQLKTAEIEKVHAQKAVEDIEEMILGLALSESAVRRWLPAVKIDMLQNDTVKQILQFLQQNNQADMEELLQNLQKFDQYVKIILAPRPFVFARLRTGAKHRESQP